MEENLSNEDLIVDHDYEMLWEINEESCSSEIVSDSDKDSDNQEIQSCSAKQVENSRRIHLSNSYENKFQKPHFITSTRVWWWEILLIFFFFSTFCLV